MALLIGAFGNNTIKAIAEEAGLKVVIKGACATNAKHDCGPDQFLTLSKKK